MMTNEERALQRSAFIAGARWRQSHLEADAALAADARFPHIDIQAAPSGKFYRIVPTEWGMEIRAWDSEGGAFAGQCPYYLGLKYGDEKTVALLLERFVKP